jgi:hypothetical protein
LQNLTIDRAAALQTDFMDRVANRLEAASEFREPKSGRTFAGRARLVEEYPTDFAEELARVQRASRVYDEVLLERMCRGARILYEIRPSGLLRFGTAMLVFAAVLQPFRELLLRLTPGPRAFDDLSGLPPEREGGGPPRVLAVLSPSGWRDGPDDAEDPGEGADTVIRFEPAPEGGYRRFPVTEEPLPAFLALESEEELLERVRKLAEARRVDLVLRGLAARRISRESGVPVETVREAFRSAAREDEFLRAVEEDGDLLLRRA